MKKKSLCKKCNCVNCKSKRFILKEYLRLTTK